MAYHEIDLGERRVVGDGNALSAGVIFVLDALKPARLAVRVRESDRELGTLLRRTCGETDRVGVMSVSVAGDLHSTQDSVQQTDRGSSKSETVAGVHK